VPEGPVAMVASIVESLAIAFAKAAHTAGDLAGISVSDISMVGGGSLNTLLCQRLADHAEVPVVAGPVEATALGNLLVQAGAAGLMSRSPDAMRDVVRRTSNLTRYTPCPRGELQS
jgi:rhamnulokinase